ncbi:MAG TPA: NADH-quinone oxidoreductase subunit C [Anaerolineaceae bacterium]|jgi:NADH-quinone oxidoreductase subunit C
MNDRLQPAARAIQERFGAALHEYAGEVYLTVTAEQIVAVCQALKTEFKFNLLANETAVDYWPQEDPRFHVVYNLYSISEKATIGLRVPLAGNAPNLPTIIPVFPAADWPERELWDMFGIRCDGHPDLRRILMPADWEGHPLRKDYPLGYEEVQFTFNVGDVALRKPRPKD